MSSELRAMAAGVLCVGFQDPSLTEGTEATLHALQPGAVILFARHTATFSQTRALTDRLRSLSGYGLPPVIAVDQEGGRVTRLRDGVDEFPSMMALRATGDIRLARRAGERIGLDLRRAGFNLNFGPVLDLAVHPQNTVIGARSFSDDPQAVIEYAGAFAAGMESAGIVATYKHFPGHGSTAIDSHLALPRLDIAQEQLRRRDLAPFAALLPNARAVMTAHIVVNSLDPLHPATTSHAVLTDLLRGQLNFRGVCFTDCMHMDAISQSIGTPQGAVEALAAGADCVSISQHLSVGVQTVDGIVEAVQNKVLPLRRLEEAAGRMHLLRQTLQAPLDSPRMAPAIGPQIARRAITVLRGDLRLRGADVAVVSFQASTIEGVSGKHDHHASLEDALRRRGVRATQHNLALDPTLEEIRATSSHIATRGAQLIILMRRAHIYLEQARAVHALLDTYPDALVISMREPFDVKLFSGAANVACTYDDEGVTVEALAALMVSGDPAAGTFPVSLSAAG